MPIRRARQFHWRLTRPSRTVVSSEVIVSLANGVVYRVRGDVGTPDSDLARQGQRLREKFDALVTPVLGSSITAELAEMVDGIDSLDDVRGMMALSRG